MSGVDPVDRFSDRAENYARYRPGYPPAVLECLREECGLSPQSVIADVGSGTGILAAMFLANGNRVFGVEPNEAMRSAAERSLGSRAGFSSIAGRAEATTLLDHSVDMVVAGQAFHWFDAMSARMEFRRILRPNGYVALIWNARLHRDDPLMVAYERVLGAFDMGYHAVTHRAHAGDLDAFYLNGRETRIFSHSRPLDFDMFWGGFLSASYAPLPDDPRYEPMRVALRAVFDAYQQDGQVLFLYDTFLYFGRL